MPAWLLALPWGKIAIGIALCAAVIYGVHLIEQHAEDVDTIASLKNDLLQEKKDFDALTKQYAASTKAIDDANTAITGITAKAQHQQEAIHNAKPSDNGPTRAVISDTLNWMRNSPAGGTQDGAAAH